MGLTVADNSIANMPGTPKRKPTTATAAVTVFDDKPHKKLIRRTLSYKQLRRRQSETTDQEFTIARNLLSNKTLSNSVKNVSKIVTDKQELKNRKNETGGVVKRSKTTRTTQRPVSLDLDAVTRVLNADWSDDFKVALFNPKQCDFSPLVGGEYKELHLLKPNSVKANGNAGFKKSLRLKDKRKKLSLVSLSTDIEVESMRSPSIGGYLKESWDSLLTKVTDRNSSDMRKYMAHSLYDSEVYTVPLLY